MINLDTNNAYFFHFNFSHWYILFDENCNYIPMYDQYGNDNNLQNYKGNTKNTECVLKKIKFIIKSFKENDIYDGNTIIFKSDHGKPIGFHESDLYNTPINQNTRWGVGRYNSFFMVKKKNELKPGINISNKHVSSKYLYNIYCNNLPFKIICKKKDEDILLIPVNRGAFQDLKDFKKINLEEFKSFDF